MNEQLRKTQRNLIRTYRTRHWRQKRHKKYGSVAAGKNVKLKSKRGILTLPKIEIVTENVTENKNV